MTYIAILRFYVINPSTKVLHIQFGGQYLPQYNIFCYMSYIIMNAWLSSFPMIPITLVYSVSGLNDSFMNGVGPFCKVPNIHHCRHWTILLCVLLNLLCPVHTYRLTIFKVFFCSDIDITMIIITMIHTMTCHVCHLCIKPVSFGQTKKWMVEFVWGVDQENVLLGASMQSRPEPHWTVMGPAGERCSYGDIVWTPCRISVRLW